MNPNDQGSSDQSQTMGDNPPPEPVNTGSEPVQPPMSDSPTQGSDISDIQPPIIESPVQDAPVSPPPPAYMNQPQEQPMSSEPTTIQDQFKQSTEPINPPGSETITQPMDTGLQPEPQIQAEEVPPQDPPPQVPPQMDKPKSKSSFLTIIGVIVIVVLLGLVGYLAWQNSQLNNQLTETPTPQPTLQPTLAPTPTPTNDPTAGWELFTASTYNVSYPTDVTANEEAGSVLLLTKQGATQTPDTELFDGISLVFEPKEISNTTLEEYVSARVDGILKEGVATISSEPTPITVGTYTGLTYTTDGLGTFRYIILESKDKTMFMVITDATIDPENLGYADTVDLILSTFEFTQ